MATHTHPPAEALREEGAGRRHGRRRRQYGGLAAGFVLGWLLGFAVEYLVGSRLVTGSASDPFSVAFGLPAALGIMFGRTGASTTSTSRVVPSIRPNRFRRLDRVATSERGQEPGSPVTPRYPGEESARD